jgi:tetratricopeptide (TPR) repeat protein
VYLSPIVFAAACFGIWRMWKADRRIWVFGSLFFFFNVMFLLQVLGAGQGFLADRFTYVPYFGFFAIAALFYDQYVQDARWKSNLQIALAAVTVVFGVWTVRQVGIWQNGDTLWSHVIEFEGNTNSLPYWNRAQYYRAQGKFDASLKDYTQAININPEKPELYNSRGKTYFDMSMSGKFKDQSKDFLQKALSDYNVGLSKTFPKPEGKAEILINRGAAYGASGSLQKSIDDISEGLKLKPDNKNGYFNRSIAYYQLQQYDLALADYTTYLKYDPFNASILYESGMLQRSLNKNEEAIANLSRAIEIQPTLGVAYLERARAYIQIGNKAAAVKDYQKARTMGAPLNAKDEEGLK